MTNRRYWRIGEVVARTGLTERALRHYEAEGLIAPDRSAAGQRLYSAADISALATISVLRRAGFSLGEIRTLRTRRAIDIRSLLAVQIEALKLEAASAAASITVLEGMQARLATEGAADIDLLCEIAATVERCASSPAWRKVFDRYFDPEQQARWAALNEKLAASVDADAYNKAWADLAEDIKRALPIDPASAAAQTLLDRWNALLAPFNRVASAREQEEARKFWSSVGDWGASVNSPMTQDVVNFVRAASMARREQQGGPPHAET
jgi:DNA-binding transcriptional MerR regulator